MNIRYNGRKMKVEKGLTVEEALKEKIQNNEYEVIDNSKK